MQKTTSSPSVLPTLALLGAVFLWGSSFSAMKVAVAAFGPLFTVWSRMCISTALFVPLSWKLLKNGGPGRDWGWVLLVAIFQPCLYFLCEGFAVHYTTSAQAGMVSAVLPLLVAAGAHLVLKETSGPGIWIGGGLSCLGVVWLTLASSPSATAPNPFLGNTLEFAAMLSAAGYMLTVRRLAGRYSSWLLTGLQFSLGVLFFLPGGMQGPSGGWPETVWPYLLLLYLGALVTLGAFNLYNWGIARVPAGRAATFVNLVPVTAAVLGALFLDEVLSTSQIAASILVLAGVALAQSKFLERTARRQR